MDYPSAVLKALLNFCCTDEVSNLMMLEKSDEVESMRLAVKLCAAADYYGLETLKETAYDATKEQLHVLASEGCNNRMRGACICTAFQEISKTPSLQTWEARFLTAIRKNPEQALVDGTRPGVSLLSSNTLRILVEDGTLQAYPLPLLQAIQKWIPSSPVDGDDHLSPEERTEFAKDCAGKLELRLIPSKDLVGVVAKTGLVNHTKIVEALQYQSENNSIYIYGGGFEGVNGLFKEKSVNSSFDVVESDDPTRDRMLRRFDKDGHIGVVTFSVLVLALDHNDSIFGNMLAPPEGARALVITAHEEDDARAALKNIKRNNRLLYTAVKRSRYSEVEIKWKVSSNSDDIASKHKNHVPLFISGQSLSSTPTVKNATV